MMRQVVIMSTAFLLTVIYHPMKFRIYVSRALLVENYTRNETKGNDLKE
jgi:hypothetical protein